MAQNKDEIIQVIREGLVEKGVEEDKINPQANLQSDLGLDSLDIVDLTSSLEERYGIEIPDSELENVTTIEDAAGLIESKVGASA